MHVQHVQHLHYNFYSENQVKVQSNSVITNSQGPLKNIRYNRETL